MIAPTLCWQEDGHGQQRREEEHRGVGENVIVNCEVKQLKKVIATF